MKMNRLIPMLPVKSMPASVEFYQKLGFSVERRMDEWGWAMLRFDEVRLMVDQSINLHSRWPHPIRYLFIPRTLPSITSRSARTGWMFPTWI